MKKCLDPALKSQSHQPTASLSLTMYPPTVSTYSHSDHLESLALALQAWPLSSFSTVI